MAQMDRRTLAAAIALILAVLVLLRVFNVGHTLTYDEAWNVNSVIDAVEGQKADVFYGNFLRHPPLYNGLASLYALATGSGRHGLAVAMELESLIFAAGLAVALFFCGRDWFGEKPGLAAAFLFAVMPAARMCDSLVKPESLALLLGLLFLLFFLRDRFVLAGVFLGLAMLTKEIFIFLPAALLLFLLAGRLTSRLRGFAVSLGVGAAISFWWYMFVSNSKGEFLDFFLGRSLEAANWREPFWFYLGRLPDDAGWPALALCLLGLSLLALRVRNGGPPGDVGARGAERGRPPGWKMALLPVLWLVFMYAFLSLSCGKPPWLAYSAMPAFALLGGWGLVEAARVVSGPRLSLGLAAAVLACALALSAPVGFDSYFMKADRTYPLTVSYRRAADYMNERMARADRIMMPVRDFSPTIAFYLDSYSPNSVYLLPDEPRRVAGGELRGRTVILYETRTETAEIARYVAAVSPRFVVMRPGFRAGDGMDPARALLEFARPVDTGGVWVFDGARLSRAPGRTANRQEKPAARADGGGHACRSPSCARIGVCR